ncbi:hypothetical protein ACFPOE_05920 [Caenimonas terrae]|uniref:DUF2946 domain-containing protein n=1 Tax=Caenimonas terrae TaxID=696074 RepID=A0ABW0ND39_9BURK
MQRLRHATFVARLMLAWLALAIGVATAAPLVGASALELVCSGTGLKLVAKGAGGGTAPAGHTLDCPLCVHMDAPPVLASAREFRAQGTSGPVVAVRPARIAVRTTAPPPARGPPAQA